MDIKSISNPASNLDIKNSGQSYETKGSATSFADILKNNFNDTNNMLLDAEKKSMDLATGENKDIHGTMIALQKADVSLRVFTAVRNKVVSAYQEISRMSI